ncbi:MAG: hypothetical protein DMG64_19430 [Acidobacteria bacterium]|nr:MAG: hypothetical protein DMG64_19430 [Acidobacteriota bacterium]
MGSSEWQFKSRFEPELPVPDVTPRKVATGFLPVIALDRKSSTPLHRQIYDIYRAAIVNGNLAPLQKIPSSRALAAELRISRIPVLSAYAQLLGEGYLESVGGGGTFVSKSLPDRFPSSQHSHGLWEEGRSPWGKWLSNTSLFTCGCVWYRVITKACAPPRCTSVIQWDPRISGAQLPNT